MRCGQSFFTARDRTQRWCAKMDLMNYIKFEKHLNPEFSKQLPSVHRPVGPTQAAPAQHVLELQVLHARELQDHRIRDAELRAQRVRLVHHHPRDLLLVRQLVRAAEEIDVPPLLRAAKNATGPHPVP